MTWERCPIVFQGHPSNFKVTRDKKKLQILTRIESFRTATPVWIGYEMMHKAWRGIEGCSIVFRCHPSNFKIAMAKKLMILTWIQRFRTVTPGLIYAGFYKWCSTLDGVYKRSPIIFQGHPPNFKVTRAKILTIFTRIERFWTVTPVWIHRWLLNAAQSLKEHGRGAPRVCSESDGGQKRVPPLSLDPIAHAQHIEAETRWPPFSRRHFQMHFLQWKCINFN